LIRLPKEEEEDEIDSRESMAESDGDGGGGDDDGGKPETDLIRFQRRRDARIYGR
jgi:hypothetical protein